jgi:PST family polysaccharide transporter
MSNGMPSEIRTPSPPSALRANLGALVGSHAIGLLVPLLTVPYLARTLHPAGWAPVLLAQALAAWVVMLLDYGFELSGARAVANARAAGRELASVVWRIQSAKLLLLPLGALLLLGAAWALPALRADGALVAWALLFALARGLHPLWYFQGMERVRGAVAMDTGGRVLAALAVFALVRDPSHGWRVVALQGAAAVLSGGWLTMRLWREQPSGALSLRAAARTLRTEWALFAFKASSTLYMQANTVLLGLFAPALAVAAYGGAEKIAHAAINLLDPLTRVLLPRISYLVQADAAAAAAALVRRVLLWLGGGASVAGALLALLAPQVVSLLLGSGYDAAVPVLRLLALLLPIIAIGTVLGIFWALPLGRDRALLVITAAAGVLNVLLVLALVPRHGASGMAGAVVVAELPVSASLAVTYARWRPLPPAVA